MEIKTPSISAITGIDYFEFEDWAQQFFDKEIGICDLLGDGIGNDTTHTMSCDFEPWNEQDMEEWDYTQGLLLTLMCELPEGTPDHFAIRVSW